MAGKNDPIVIFHRFTTLAGASQPFFTAPIAVSQYDGLTFDLWHGPLTGVPGPPTLMIEQSNDCEVWSDCSSGSVVVPVAIGQMSYLAILTMAWLRVGLRLAGGTTGMTLWAEGFLQKREV